MRVLLDAQRYSKKRSSTQLLHLFGLLVNGTPALSPLPPMTVQSTKANLEKQRKTNAKSAREQRQALQMTYQVGCVSETNQYSFPDVSELPPLRDAADLPIEPTKRVLLLQKIHSRRLLDV